MKELGNNSHIGEVTASSTDTRTVILERACVAVILSDGSNWGSVHVL